MEPVRLGVVGLGWISQLVHLPILKKLPEAEIVAVCDRDKSRAHLVGEKFGIDRVYTDLDKMLESETLTALVIATPTDSHKDIALAGMTAGLDVLIEKPIARTYAEAVAVADTAKELKRKVMVGMNHRFRPDTMVLKSFLQGKELGKILYTKAGWLRKRTGDRAWVVQKEKSGGGVFLDLGIVMLDLTFWLMDFPAVKKVSATHFNTTTKSVEDTSLVMISMKNGAVIQLEVSWSMLLTNDVYYYQIFGTDGSAGLNPLRINKELHGNLVNMAPAKMEPPQNLYKRSYENELKHFLGAVNDVHPVISTAAEAVERMRIVEAIYKSVRTGKEVNLA